MLLRRSCCCDGVAAATELRSTSSVALILRVASLGRDAQNDETSIHFPHLRYIFNDGVGLLTPGIPGVFLLREIAFISNEILEYY